MRTRFAVCAAFLGLCWPAPIPAQGLEERPGIKTEQLLVFDEPSMPAKELRVLRTMYAPGAGNPKHYHVSQVVFYVLEGSGIFQDEGKAAVTLKAGDTLVARAGTVHSHRNASDTEKLVFLSYVVIEKGQRSTIRMP